MIKIKLQLQIVSNRLKLVPSGLPIGVRLNVDGVFVVGFSDIETNNRKKQSPAVINGIEIGDCIIEADGQKLMSSRPIIQYCK